MACILVDGVVQGTFTIKDLEKAIRDICSKDNGIDTFPTPIGFKTVIPERMSVLYVLLKFKKILIKKLSIVFIVINLLVNV